MHPAFAESGRAAAIPIWFVTCRDLARHPRRPAGARRGPLPMPRASSPSPAGISPCPPRRAGSPASCSGSRRTRRAPTRCCRATCPACCRPGIYAFANAPHDTRLAALAFALGSYRFSRYRKREDKLATLVRAGRRRCRRPLAHRRWRHAGARSDQYARRTTWDRPNCTRRRGCSPSGTMPGSRRSPTANCC